MTSPLRASHAPASETASVDAASALLGAHALVTGGGSGIGRAIALALDGAGASVTITGRREAQLAETAERFVSGGGWLKGDLTEAGAADRLAQAATDRAGPVAVLVNNAGAADSAPFVRTDDDLLRRMLAINLEAAFALSRAVLPAMLDRPWGRIVNIASTAGLKGYAYVSAYVAAKHGLIGLTRALATEIATSAVTVNAICPGFTDTPLLDRSVATIARKTGGDDVAARAALAGHNPQNRLTQPEEIAETVLFLCAPAACGVTGQALVVAGGEVM